MGAPTSRGRAPTYDFAKYSKKNCMKLKEFGPRGASKILLCGSATELFLTKNCPDFSLKMKIRRISKIFDGITSTQLYFALKCMQSETNDKCHFDEAVG